MGGRLNCREATNITSTVITCATCYANRGLILFFNFFVGWQVILSVFLTIPCGMGVGYLLFYQLHRLRLEYILCALMLSLQAAELFFAILFVFTLCRPPSYD